MSNATEEMDGKLHFTCIFNFETSFMMTFKPLNYMIIKTCCDFLSSEKFLTAQKEINTVRLSENMSYLHRTIQTNVMNNANEKKIQTIALTIKNAKVKIQNQFTVLT